MHSYIINIRSTSEERMKYNKWTVALAALGVVSFASAVNAEEKASPVMTALSSTTISGYVDTSAEWNPGTGNANLPPYKFNGANKADGFNLDVIQLRIDKPDRKSTRLNSSHANISYAVFCLKKKKQTTQVHFIIPNDFVAHTCTVPLRAS